MTDDKTLTKALAEVLNRHSAENVSNTPDFLLASFLKSCLIAFDATVNGRSQWYGRHDEPGIEDLSIEKTILLTVVKPLCYQDLEMLKTKASNLKMGDGESWAIGEMVERAIRYIELSVQLANEQAVPPLPTDHARPGPGDGWMSKQVEQLLAAAMEAETLLMNYLYQGTFPRGSDCDEVFLMLNKAINPFRFQYSTSGPAAGGGERWT